MYGHFLPSEYTGYADALSRPPNAPYAHPEALVPTEDQGDGAASPTRVTSFRLPVIEDRAQIPDHAQEHRPEPEASGESETPVAKVRSGKKGTRKRSVKRPVGQSRKKGH